MPASSGSSRPPASTSGLRPPAQPVYVLRGHQAQIHTVQFIRANPLLATGDADGWLVLWALDTKRAAAVWKAHENAIVGIAAWDQDRVIT